MKQLTKKQVLLLSLLSVITLFLFTYDISNFASVSRARPMNSATSGSTLPSDSGFSKDSLAKGIANSVLRLHIIADSNSDVDQALKLQVRESVVEYLRPYLSDITSKEKAIEEVKRLLPEIELTANQALLQAVSEDMVFSDLSFALLPYTAKASLTRSFFPIKTYGDLTLPAGEYDALKIELGSARGKNWWCLIFPQLCFADLTYSTVPDSSKAELKELLTEEEFQAVFPDGTKKNLRPRFKLISWLKKYFAE